MLRAPAAVGGGIPLRGISKGEQESRNPQKVGQHGAGLAAGGGAAGQGVGLSAYLDGHANSEQKKRWSLQREEEFEVKHTYCLRC